MLENRLQTANQFEYIILRNRESFHPVIDFDARKEHLLLFDFTSANKELTEEITTDIDRFSDYIDQRLLKANCRFGIGGYAEHRTVYSRSTVFDAAAAGEEPRRLHLGVDIWGPAGTPVTVFMGGMVHSCA